VVGVWSLGFRRRGILLGFGWFCESLKVISNGIKLSKVRFGTAVIHRTFDAFDESLVLKSNHTKI
jgi:hypothetical protein